MAGSSLALIVASDHYDDPGLQRLRGPVQDAEALARILADPAIGGFDVRTLLNQPAFLVCEEIEGFFADRRRDDLLLVYFSCHGVKDENGRLYFASSNTKLQRLAATAVPSVFVNEQMDQSRSRKIVLLDCCYSGAFGRGMAARAGVGVDVQERFEGRGRVVITASTAMEYAFELDGDRLSGEGIPSVFTSAVVRGLESGAADLDGDGRISVDELYDYVFEQVRDATPHQTPSMMSNVQGDLYIAQGRRKLAEQRHVGADNDWRDDRGTGGPVPSEVSADQAAVASPQAPGETITMDVRSSPAPSPKRRLPGVAAVVIVLAVAGLIIALLASLARHPGTAAPAAAPTSGGAPTSSATPTTAPPGVASRGTARLSDPLQGFDLLNGRTVDFTQSSMAWSGSALAIFDDTTLGAVNLGRVRFERFRAGQAALTPLRSG